MTSKTPTRDLPSTTPRRDSPYRTPQSDHEQHNDLDTDEQVEPIIAPFPERPDLIAGWLNHHFNHGDHEMPAQEYFVIVDQILRIRDFQDIERLAEMEPPEFGEEFGRSHRTRREDALARLHLNLKYLVAVPSESTLGYRTLESYFRYRERHWPDFRNYFARAKPPRFDLYQRVRSHGDTTRVRTTHTRLRDPDTRNLPRQFWTRKTHRPSVGRI